MQNKVFKILFRLNVFVFFKDSSTAERNLRIFIIMIKTVITCRAFSAAVAEPCPYPRIKESGHFCFSLKLKSKEKRKMNKTQVNEMAYLLCYPRC